MIWIRSVRMMSYNIQQTQHVWMHLRFTRNWNLIERENFKEEKLRISFWYRSQFKDEFENCDKGKNWVFNMYLYLFYGTYVDLAVLLSFFFFCLFCDCYQINSSLQVDRLIFNLQFHAWEFHSHLVGKGDRIRLTIPWNYTRWKYTSV